MLIKEYRIPLPLTVEEYRIAQLYMIAKKSRLESEGQDSGVEIIKNEPYHDVVTDQKGQYTVKHYYVASHLPSWIKSFFNQSVLAVKEEAWNAYPYTKTIYTCALFDRFYIEIETKYLDDAGTYENVFDLNENDLKKLTIDLIDIVKDPISKNDYRKEEDPSIFISEKTGRGPLTEDWLEEYNNMSKLSTRTKNVMCAYKLCKVQFNYWGLKSRMEKFIHETALRKVMLRAHRQAWVWQDEWFGLTIEDIRELENETQKHLANKYKNISEITSEDKYSDNEFDINDETQINEVKFLKKDFQEKTNLKANNLNIETNKNDLDSDYFYDAKDIWEIDSLNEWSSLECINNYDLNKNKLSNDELSVSQTRTNETFSCETKNSFLIFVIHGGFMLDNEYNVSLKKSDFNLLKSTFENILRNSNSDFVSKISYRFIECPPVCEESLKFLSQLSTGCQSQNKKFSYESILIDCLPLFAISKKNYLTEVKYLTGEINKSYREFIKSKEGLNFDGKITFICDSLGGILAYDALSISKTSTENSSLTNSVHTSEISLLEYEKSHNLNLEPKFFESINIQRSKIHFKVDNLFLFGCPLALVLAFRKTLTNQDPIKPNCDQVYNIFHPMEHLVIRIEPLLDEKFNSILPVKIPKFEKKNLLQKNIDLISNIRNNLNIFDLSSKKDLNQHYSFENFFSNNSNENDILNNNTVQNVIDKWWGKNRIDYQINYNQMINSLTNNSFCQLFRSNYWQSNDVASFILERLIDETDLDYFCLESKENKSTLLEKEKWLKKRTSIKLKNLNPNHRANDVIVKEGQPQILSARFMYGPLDMITLTSEKVDIYIIKNMDKDEWTFIGSEITDKTGKIYHHISEDEKLNYGLYPIKMIVKGDYSSVDFFLTVLPPQTECVVFSIDGSLTASVSITGKDPKVRPGAVDVVRYWQELGYLIIYITGRPDMQQRKVIKWLREHNFPHGLINFVCGFTTDPLKHKAQYLKSLQQEVEILIHCAYGSSKDIWIYQTIGLNKDQIYVVGKVSKKQQTLANVLVEGYATHLAQFKKPENLQPARTNNKLILPKGNFGLCEIFDGFLGIQFNQSKRKLSKFFNSSILFKSSIPIRTSPKLDNSNLEQSEHERNTNRNLLSSIFHVKKNLKKIN